MPLLNDRHGTALSASSSLPPARGCVAAPHGRDSHVSTFCAAKGRPSAVARIRAGSSESPSTGETVLTLPWRRSCFGISCRRTSTAVTSSSSVRTWSFGNELNIERQGANAPLPTSALSAGTDTDVLMAPEGMMAPTKAKKELQAPPHAVVQRLGRRGLCDASMPQARTRSKRTPFVSCPSLRGRGGETAGGAKTPEDVECGAVLADKSESLPLRTASASRVQVPRHRRRDRRRAVPLPRGSHSIGRQSLFAPPHRHRSARDSRDRPRIRPSGPPLQVRTADPAGISAAASVAAGGSRRWRTRRGVRRSQCSSAATAHLISGWPVQASRTKRR